MSAIGALAATIFRQPFVPVQHTYTSGSGTETVPAGASLCVITVQAAGNGAYISFSPPSSYINTPGNSGAESVKTISVTGGNTLNWVLGAPGSLQNASAAPNSTVAGTVLGGAVNMTAGGGTSVVSGTQATATGGNTNSSGVAGSGATGGVAPLNFLGIGNGGNNGQGGAAGVIQFSYT